NIYLLGFVAFIENFSSGMGTIALLAFIMSLCNLHYTATQFALLTAFSFLSRIIIGPISIAIVDSVGWENYYLICFFMSLFTLIFVWINKKRISPI
ncbi:MAG: MFS transporter, partial [bacterium]|nr:MFS transporter [bacterium]